MKVSEVVEVMIHFAGILKMRLSQTTFDSDADYSILTEELIDASKGWGGYYPTVNFQRALIWLQAKRPQMFGPLKQAYYDVMSCAKKPFPMTSGRDILDHYQNLRYRMFLFAKILEDTADDLQKAPAADLAAKQPAEQNTTLFGKILEKVLYIFTRSFWDAVFDRRWPK